MRHFVDTRQEMDVVHFGTGRPRITPQRLQDQQDDGLRPPDPPSNPAIALPYLSSIYNWCAYDGCRPISKSARIYVRQGLQGRYKWVPCPLHLRVSLLRRTYPGWCKCPSSRASWCSFASDRNRRTIADRGKQFHYLMLMLCQGC